MMLDDIVIAGVDDHIIEPATLWDQHLSVQQKSIAPVVKRDKNGKDYWLFEERPVTQVGEKVGYVLGGDLSEEVKAF